MGQSYLTLTSILKPLSKIYNQSSLVAQSRGEIELGRPLKHLPDYWDPGKSKLLHCKKTPDADGLSAVMVQLPHRQNVILGETKFPQDWVVLDIPLPYVYYFIHLQGFGSTLSLQVAGIGCSLTFKDLKKKSISVFPMPNTGTDLYTCSMPITVKPTEKIVDDLFYAGALEGKTPASKSFLDLVEEVSKIAITNFWSEGFHYHEKVCNAHNLLYTWGGVYNLPGYNAHVNLAPYEKWSKLKLRDLDKQAWLNVNIPHAIVKPWVS